MGEAGFETNKYLVALAKQRLEYKFNRLDRMTLYVNSEVISAKRLAANEAFQKAVKDLL